MSERMTGIHPRGGHGGIEDWGRKTRAEMIAQYRAHYEHQRADAEAALAVADEDLVVETYLGTWAMRNRQEVTA